MSRLVFTFVIFLLVIGIQTQADEYTDSLAVRLRTASAIQKIDIQLEMATHLVDTDPQTALEYAKHAAKGAQKANNPQKNITAQLLMGKAYANQQKFVKALDIYKDALSTAQRHNDGVLMAKSLKLSADVYFTKGNYEDAIKFYHNAIQLLHKNTPQKELAYLYLQIGKSFRLIGDLMQAQGSFIRAIQAADQSKVKNIQADALLGLSDINMTMENYSNAFQYAQDALKLAQLPYLQINIYKKMAAIQLFENKKTDAIYSLKKALEVAQYNKLTDEEANIYKDLSEIYTETKEFETALSYSALHSQKTADLLAENYQHDMYEMRKQYDNKTNALILNHRNIEKANKMRLTVSFITNLLLVAGFVFVLLRYQKISKTNKEIRITNTDIAKKLKSTENKVQKQIKELHKIQNNLTQEQVQRVEILHELEQAELKSNLMAIGAKNAAYAQLKEELTNLDEKQTKSKLEELNKKWNKEIEIETDTWTNTLSKLHDLYPNFYSLFVNAYPQLTENEMRHVVFMKIGLSTKEIADLMNIGVRGVQTARYRIKKKMELPHDDDLIQYINNFSV